MSYFGNSFRVCTVCGIAISTLGSAVHQEQECRPRPCLPSEVVYGGHNGEHPEQPGPSWPQGGRVVAMVTGTATTSATVSSYPGPWKGGS